MKSLTGAQAVARLERRGGQIWVFRRGYGSTLIFDCVDRDNGQAVVALRDPEKLTAKPSRPRTLRTDADRAAVARQMEEARDWANSKLERVESRYELIHRDVLGSDAGYGQIGCFLVVASVVVGLIVGLAVAWLATGGVTGYGWAIGPIVGLSIGFLTTDTFASIVAGIPALRDQQVNLFTAWVLIVPGVATAAVAIAMAVLKIDL